jgi:hypothetical protein
VCRWHRRIFPIHTPMRDYVFAFRAADDLGRFQGGKSALGRGGGRGAVAPKYRNPENPAETCAGRGLKPRWLTAAIKGGKDIEDFAVAGATTSSAQKGSQSSQVISSARVRMSIVVKVKRGGAAVP